MKNGKVEEDERIIVKCDPGCGWYIDVESIDEVEEWLNKECPECHQEDIITPSDISILRQTQRAYEKTFGGNIQYPLDTAMSRNLKDARPFDIDKEYPEKEQSRSHGHN